MLECLTYISIKIDPNGSTPPSMAITAGSINLQKNKMIPIKLSVSVYSSVDGVGNIATKTLIVF